MASIPFFLPDTSPIFEYAPCIDCASTSSWTAAYSPAGDDLDQTFHQSSSSDSTVAFNISASTLAISSKSNGSDCGAMFSINGSDFSSACDNSSASALSSLPEGLHKFVVRPGMAGTNFQLIGVSGTVPLTSSGRQANTSVDDNSSFVYSPGGWTQTNSAGVIGSPANQTVALEYTDVGAFMNRTVSVSTELGSSANLSFQAEAIYVFGMSGPEGGTAQVLLDGQISQTLNLSNPWKAYSSLLYMRGGFQTSDTHSLSIINTSPGGQLVIDFAVLTAPFLSTSSISTHLTPIIGIISGTSAFLLILGVFAFLCCNKYRNPFRKAPYGCSSGNRNLSRDGSIDSWRKHTAGASPITPYTAQTGSPRGPPISVGFPLPDFPAYLPYHGPLEPPPKEEHDIPLTIVGANPTARGWLQTYAVASRFDLESGQLSARKNLPISQVPPVPLRTSRKGFDDIDLDHYHSYEADLDTTIASSPSSLALTGITARAGRATRSVARLWPSRDAVPSTLRHSAQMPLADSVLFAPSYTTAGQLSSSASQMLGSGIAPRRNTTAVSRSDHSVSHPSSVYSTMRRGVSIKSVKTIRSFFSGLLFSTSSTSSSEQTPAIPQPAARPDSGIFPSGSLSRSSSTNDDGHQSSRGMRRGMKQIGQVSAEGGTGTIPDLMIELNPNSPMTVGDSSRPESEWTRYRSGFTSGI